MSTFLHDIASIFYNNHTQKSLHETLFVFPNRRAGLFFRKEMCAIARHTIFVPNTSDINRFTASLSKLQKANDIELLLHLYNAYVTVCSATQSDNSPNIESFDNFIGIGTSMLSDFNEIDKYLVNAERLFVNVSDLKDLTNHTNFFSKAQLNAISSFWNNAVIHDEDDNLSFKKKFISLWNNLLPIYHLFRETLRDKNLAYEGMQYRDVIENVLPHPQTRYDFKHIVFIGFNSLTASEHAILAHFKKNGMADFYFDYPTMYDGSPFTGSVAMCYKQNQKEFPSLHTYQQPTEVQCAECTVYGTPSTFNQSQVAGSILHQIYTETGNDMSAVTDKTAILLADETELTSVLQNLPSYTKDLNITMGYPLNMSPIANLIENITALQTESSIEKTSGTPMLYHKPLINILTHPYIQRRFHKTSNAIINHLTRYNHIRISSEYLHDFVTAQSHTTQTERDFFLLLFQIQTTSDELFRYMDTVLDYMQQYTIPDVNTDHGYKFELEYILQYQKYLKQLRHSLEQSGVEINIKTVHTLIKRITANLKIQFNGEPLRGLQIMGMLESRLIDFDNIILLGFNDAKIPGNSFSDSLIPYNLRRAYSLPTYELGDAIYAYNFYRMLYRVKHLHVIHDSRQNDAKSEISRFYYQLKYLMPLTIKGFEVKYKDVSLHIPTQGNDTHARNLVIEKNDRIMAKLNQFKNNKNLTASRLKDYITCPLKFYFHTVAEINQANEIEETMQAGLFGSIFHKAMELYYKNPIPRKMSDDEIKSLVKEAFAEEGKDSKKNIEIRGFNMLTFRIICSFVNTAIAYDLKRSEFQYLGSEKNINCKFDNVNFTGVIDRIDRTTANGTVNIIDYKTTTTDKTTGVYNIIDLFNSPKSACHEIFQILLYCYFFYNADFHPDKDLTLYKLQKEKPTLKPALYNLYEVSKITASEAEQYDLETIRLKVPEALTDAENMPDFDIDLEELKRTDPGETVEVTTYNTIRTPYEWLLRRMLHEIYNPATPFTTTPANSNSEGCKYCPYLKLCNREKEVRKLF